MTSMSPPNAPMGYQEGPGSAESRSPQQSQSPKDVTFELLFQESPQYRARLPLRVQIYPHDATDSIVTTVKNFYGLYGGPKCISFEDGHGHTLIARYENFHDQMIVYVRVVEESPATSAAYPSHPLHPAPMEGQAYYGNGGYGSREDLGRFPDSTARPDLAPSHTRSPSPHARGRRSDSAGAAGRNGRSRSVRNGSIANAQADAYSDSMNGYSSGDGASGSASGRSRDHLGNTDISVENIVEGGRRKRAKFESSVWNLTSVFSCLFTYPCFRNFHSLLHHKCQRQPPTLRCRRLAASTLSASPCHTCSQESTTLQILGRCNPLSNTHIT